MKYESVFFDLDGTVIDSLQDIADAVNHTLSAFGLPYWPPEALRPHLGWGAGVLIRSILPEGWKPRTDELLAHYLPYYAAHAADKSCPFPGIPEALRRLKAAGLPLAIVSNKPDSAVRPLAERYFADTMDLCVGELPGVARKPAPDMLQAAADRLGVRLDRCLYVGDSEVDIQTAQNTGIDCLTVTWGFRSRQQLLDAGAVYVVDTPEELAAFILN